MVHCAHYIMVHCAHYIMVHCAHYIIDHQSGSQFSACTFHVYHSIGLYYIQQV